MKPKFLYWRMYQDKESIKYASVVLTKDQMDAEISMYFDNPTDDGPPIFEPVMMTEKEFNDLPEFDGF